MTEKAIAKIRTAMVKEGISPEQGGLRLGVQGGGCSGSELQHPLRHPAARARPHFRLRRGEGFCGSQIVHLSSRHDAGLPGNADAAGLRICEPQCVEVLRLRDVVLGLKTFVDHPPRRHVRLPGFWNGHSAMTAVVSLSYGNGKEQFDGFIGLSGRRYVQLLVVRRHARGPVLQRLRQSSATETSRLLYLLWAATKAEPGLSKTRAGVLCSQSPSAS